MANKSKLYYDESENLKIESPYYKSKYYERPNPTHFNLLVKMFIARLAYYDAFKQMETKKILNSFFLEVISKCENKEKIDYFNAVMIDLSSLGSTAYDFYKENWNSFSIEGVLKAKLEITEKFLKKLNKKYEDYDLEYYVNRLLNSYNFYIESFDSKIDLYDIYFQEGFALAKMLFEENKNKMKDYRKKDIEVMLNKYFNGDEKCKTL